MRLVVADTGPVNYLILTGDIDLLLALFEKVILPEAVHVELIDVGAPSPVRNWIANPPAWIEVRATPAGYFDMNPLGGIDMGEKSAIALADTLKSEMLLMDYRKGVKTARSKGLRVTGTLGILELASRAGLIDFAQAVARLRRTNFRSLEALLGALLKRHAREDGDA